MRDNGSKILTLNCGSSSVRFSLWDKNSLTRIHAGIIERIGTESALLNLSNSAQSVKKTAVQCMSHADAIKIILEFITSPSGASTETNKIAAVGHRVVHGGEKFKNSAIINSKVMRAIEKCCELAPLHNPPNLEGIRRVREHLPKVPQVAVFDTAFLSTIPLHAHMYAIPYEFYKKLGVRRYGFHGTSHLYLSKRAAVLLRKKPHDVNLITLHIGNGVSITAVKNGLAYDHSMGFTPLEGAIMGTRSGDLDPAIPLYLMNKKGYTPTEMGDILNKKSGILGVTGKYYDRRDLLAAARRGEHRAKLTIQMECHRLRKYVGGYAAILGKVDAIIFSAGVGENIPLYRRKICENMQGFGIEVDQRKNKKAIGNSQESDISTPNSRTKVFVIPTNEELVMVEDTKALTEERGRNHFKVHYSFEKEDFVVRD